MTVIGFQKSYFTISLRFNKFSLDERWYHGTISSGMNLQSCFAVFYCKVLPCYWHVKHNFPCIVHSRICFRRCLTNLAHLLPRWNCFVGQTYLLRLGFTSAYFSKVPLFFTGVTFVFQNRTWLVAVWLKYTSIAQVITAFTTSHLVFKRFFWSFIPVFLWLAVCYLFNNL